MDNIDNFDNFDIDDLTLETNINRRIEYIFKYVENKIDKKDYFDIDQTINKIIKNGYDLSVDQLTCFLFVICDVSDYLNNYNKLYHFTYIKCLKIINQFEMENTLKMETILIGLKRNDYDEWIISKKINKINDNIKRSIKRIS